MEDYAKRGVFRGFTRVPARKGIAAFSMIWHCDRVFDLFVDSRKRTIQIPVVLPAVPPRSPLYKNFKAFVASHQSPNLSDHRRIEKSKVRVACAHRRGSISLTMAVKDGDYEYALQCLIHLVQETYLIFLPDGPYRDYMVDQLGAAAEIG
jgi:hypothetical protein